MYYLDYQATTPLAPEALESMLPLLSGPGSDGFANPSSQYRAGRAAAVAVEMARDEVAALLPKGGRVFFTSGATEALNWAIKGSRRPITTIATEHAAVLDTVATVGDATILPVDRDGRVATPPASDELVVAMLVADETGLPGASVLTNGSRHDSADTLVHVSHIVPAEMPRRIGEPVREQGRFREQKQPRGLHGVPRHTDRARLLLV